MRGVEVSESPFRDDEAEAEVLGRGMEAYAAMTTSESRTVEPEDTFAETYERLSALMGDALGLYSRCSLTHQQHHFPRYLEEQARAILAAAKEHGLVIGEGELDRAWKEAEEALPEDYTLELKSNGRTAYFAASLPPFLPYEQWFAARREAFGLSPAEALQG